MSATRHTRRGSAVLLLCLGLGLAGCSRPHAVSAATPEAHETPSQIVLGDRDIAAVALGTIERGIRLTGSLDPAERVEVKAQLAGQLEQVHVERGSSVRLGEVLANYDDRTFRAQQAEAEARLAAAERDLEAAEMLYREGALSLRDQVNAKVARDAAEAQLTVSQETSKRARVTAALAGVISHKATSEGEAVTAGQHLFTIVNIETLELVGQVPAQDSARVRPGQQVRLHLDAYPDRLIVGSVARVEPVADPETRQVAIHVRVPNRDRRLVAGLFATGTILVDGEGDLGDQGAEQRPVIPTAALSGTADQPAVFVVAGGQLERRAVVLGARDRDSGRVEVTQGLREGEVLLLTPAPTLRGGESVTRTAPASSAAPFLGATPTTSGGIVAGGSR